jgi:hypothetical protein
MNRLGPAALALSLLALCGCNGSSDPAQLTDSGYAALGKSDWKAAASDFDRALASLKATDAGYLRAKLGQVEALIHTDAPKAKTEFLATASAETSGIEVTDYTAVASKLASEKKFPEAIDVLAAGKKKYPANEKINDVGKAMAQQAKKAGDAGASKALAGLGYLGD